MADLWDNLMQAGQGFANGARSFGDQAKWQMGAYGNAPMPAPYAGGPDYPAKNDANAYVRNNYPPDNIAPTLQKMLPYLMQLMQDRGK